MTIKSFSFRFINSGKANFSAFNIQNFSIKHFSAIHCFFKLKVCKSFSGLIILFCFFSIQCFGGDVYLKDKDNLSLVGKKMEMLSDTGNQYNAANISTATQFAPAKAKVTIIGSVPKHDLWLRFTAHNSTTQPTIYFFLKFFNISEIDLYRVNNGKLELIYRDGHRFDNAENFSLIPSYVSDLHLAPNQQATFYVRIFSSHPVVLPVYIGARNHIKSVLEKESFILFAYAGMLLAIFLYNLFLYFVTKDKNYLIYVAYVLLLCIAQLTVPGYTLRFFFNFNSVVNEFAVPVTTSVAVLSGILFTIFFLRTRIYTPTAHKVLVGCFVLFLAAIGFSLVGNNEVSYHIIVVTQSIAGITSIIASYIIARSGYRPALFYLISWLFVMVALVILTLRNFTILPYNNFTTYVLHIGTALEAVLISIALADRINTLKKEKEISQAEALRVSQENEKLVREQNIVLEQKVNQRTEELQNTNSQLNRVLSNLKETQTQLVEAEKMASLGQLTAGIAHEINNPINFVKSNISPLRLDVQDLMEVLDEYNKLHLSPEGALESQLKTIKQLQNSLDIGFIKNEINDLIKGIEEGAERTAEIVQGLRTFSRLDESSLKKVDLHSGIDSTLVLLRNSIPWYINIRKKFEATGEVECYPGKLNQVFMNIINNAVQAIGSKDEKHDEVIEISTRNVGDAVEVSIKDTGIGMTEDVKHRIFEPFFTTKEVGEGTGLGMAITFKIIQHHNGKILINSSPGKGAEFILTLPCEINEVAVS